MDSPVSQQLSSTGAHLDCVPMSRINGQTAGAATRRRGHRAQQQTMDGTHTTSTSGMACATASIAPHATVGFAHFAVESGSTAACASQ